MSEEYVDPHAPQEEPAPLPTHAGPLPAMDDDFFADLPVEIGEPLSVHTNWKQGKTFRSIKSRIMGVILAVVIVGGVGHWFERSFMGLDVPVFSGIMAVIIALAVFFVGKKPTATYVGRDGWSRHWKSHTSPDRVQSKVMLFASADTLHTQETRQYYNGVYTGTNYVFVWKDTAGKAVGRLNGSYRSKEGTPKPEDLFWFAKSAEAAWSEHWMQRTMPEFESNGFVVFRFGTDKTIHVGQGFLEFHWKGKEHVVEHQDIAALGFHEGTLKMQFHDKGIMKRGKFNVGVKDIPNFRCFIIALERLFGYRFGP